MKLVSLNTAGGIRYERLVELLARLSGETDLFCFQEVFPCKDGVPRKVVGDVRKDLFSDLGQALSSYNGFHAMASEGDVGGLAIFTKKALLIESIEHLTIFDEQDPGLDEKDEHYFSMGRDLQRVRLMKDNKEFSILNFHGMWTGRGKGDTDGRILQSQKIRKVFDESIGARILCGDLNLEPDTKSLGILTQDNKDLIKENGIASTRSPLYAGPVKLADYVIVSLDVRVENFGVIQSEVSDHLPLFLDFS